MNSSDKQGGVTDRKIPNSVIKRLPLYHRYLCQLMRQKVDRISSQKLAGELGLTASQIRQDLNYFGNFGMRGYGYNVKELHNEIAQIIGLKEQRQLVIVGAGRLGRVLIDYPDFKEMGFYFRALFDNDPELIGREINGKKIYNIARLEQYLQENRIDIGVITTPPEPAREIAEILVNGGVKGIWNFAPTTFNFDQEQVVVENVCIGESLFTLTCRIKEQIERVENILG